MTKTALACGYLGLIPFFYGMFGSISNDDQFFGSMILMLYGAMILSFLGGAHWVGALKTENNPRAVFAMLPTIFSCGLLPVWFYCTQMLNSGPPLLLMGILFWIVYAMDMKYIKVTKEDDMPNGYARFRLILTIIVSATYFTSAFYALSTLLH